ncbi:MAG: M20/M25/M40 family metallo-hydrolase [Myxococcota bacterium]
MLSRLYLPIALALVSCQPESEGTATPGEDQPVAAPSASVALDNERMQASLAHLASDAMAGRYTLTPENLGAAADYIAAEYGKVGLRPVGESFRAPFELERGHEPGPDLHLWLETSGEVIEVPVEAYASLATGEGDAVFGDATFVGTKSPKAVARSIAVARLDEPAATAVVQARVDALAKAGARGVVMIVPARPTTPDRIKADIPVLVIAEADAGPLLTAKTKVGKTIADLKVSLAVKQVPVLHPSFNMLSWIEGSEHPEEIVIVGAHFDHIGTSDIGSFCSPNGEDRVCNGADDNASGSAMVLEIARSLAEAGYQPKRSLVFAHFAGEELGLHGSRALADHPPDAAPFSGGRVVAMINLDMVGRYRESEGLQVGAISSSDQWRPLLDAAGDQGMRLVYERSVTGRSDHANFYRKKIPVLFFFTGLHDDYHQVGDHVDKINREGMAAIGTIVTHLATAVAGGAPIVWSEPRSRDEGEVSRLPASDAKTLEQP